MIWIILMWIEWLLHSESHAIIVIVMVTEGHECCSKILISVGLFLEWGWVSEWFMYEMRVSWVVEWISIGTEYGLREMAAAYRLGNGLVEIVVNIWVIAIEEFDFTFCEGDDFVYDGEDLLYEFVEVLIELLGIKEGDEEGEVSVENLQVCDRGCLNDIWNTFPQHLKVLYDGLLIGGVGFEHFFDSGDEVIAFL